jgi:hypothetical protein
VVGDSRRVLVRVAARLKIEGRLTANGFDYTACQVALLGGSSIFLGGVNELKLQRGAATVHDEHTHRGVPPLGSILSLGYC